MQCETTVQTMHKKLFERKEGVYFPNRKLSLIELNNQSCRGVISDFIKFFEGNISFLGGLSLHLNHLIAWRLGISFQQFGTLPIGIFLSNLDSRHLMTSPRTLFGHFLATPVPFK